MGDGRPFIPVGAGGKPTRKEQTKPTHVKSVAKGMGKKKGKQQTY